MADRKHAHPTLQHSNWEAGFTLKFNKMCKQYWRGWQERRKQTMRSAPVELPMDSAPEPRRPRPALGTRKAQARTRSPNAAKQSSSTRPRHVPTPGMVREAHGHGKRESFNNKDCGSAAWHGDMGDENSTLPLSALGLITTGIG
ncbi:Hypothetical predicted protein [Pelobates cultripes]|uniref:Uncharacterized protein n=1 Tax=Pelobates cultripes TaxID=61616 RepID=A0AAD1SFM2_PELCU|nr:Hypothetical predicted protein [Pelobates cultripes]